MARCACPDGALPFRSQSDRAARSRAGSFRVRRNQGRFIPSAPRRQGPQISPGKNANCRCTSAAFTVGCVPVGFAVVCQLASHPLALYAVSVRRLAPLALRLPSDMPSRACPCLRLVVILLTMSPSGYSHRGLSPHKFAPMLGAHNRFRSRLAARSRSNLIRYVSLRQPLSAFGP